MTHRIDALSMSWRAARAVRESGWSGEVLAVHPQSCYVTGEGGEICAVVQEPLGNGPFSVVIPSSCDELALTGTHLSASMASAGHPRS